jgi:hypothetical protein
VETPRKTVPPITAGGAITTKEAIHLPLAEESLRIKRPKISHHRVATTSLKRAIRPTPRTLHEEKIRRHAKRKRLPPPRILLPILAQLNPQKNTTQPLMRTRLKQ